MDMHFDGVIFQTHGAELRRRLQYPFPPFCLIDVRPEAKYDRGHIPGAISKRPSELARALPTGTTPATEFLLVGSGPGDPRVREASLALGRLGAHRRVELTGGMHEWRQLGYEIENGSRAAA